LTFVSLTRLRLRSLRFLPAFMPHTWRSTRQIKTSAGFLGGYLATEGVRGFWTITAWDEEAAMRAYRSSGDHLRAMPKLLAWCDEASVAHWRQAGNELPGPTELLKRMVDEGRLSKVRHPSPAHASGWTAPPGVVLRAGPSIRPSGRVR